MCIRNLLIIFSLLLLGSALHGQTIIFEDDFESGTFKAEWMPQAGVNNGLVDVVSTVAGVNAAHNGLYAVALGKTTDSGGENLNVLDLNLDLSGQTNVELSFWIRDVGETNDEEDGIYFSQNGGQNFVKVFSFDARNWVDRYGQLPALDIDKLATDNGLNLTSQFVIRFQQNGFDDFNTSSGSDGILIDDVVIRTPGIEYASIPFADGFERDELGPHWKRAHAYIDGGSIAEILNVRPGGLTEIVSSIGDVNPAAHSGSKALALGRRYDGNANTNAADLHLDLSGQTNVELSFWIRDVGESNDEEDGIYFSQDGGQNFVKVFSFDARNWADRYGQLPALDIDKLATDNGLNLTSQFVIRFQQYGFDDFNNSSGTDGVFIDDVVVQSPNIEYAPVPFADGFERDELAPYWRRAHAYIDGSSIADIVNVRPGGLVEIVSAIESVNPAARSGNKALAIGRRYDGNANANAADLRLNLQNTSNVELKFWVREQSETFDNNDGIYFSNDGGESFIKVYNFDSDIISSSYEEFTLNLSSLADNVGLSLTNNFVVRFQQYGFDDFNTSSGSDGILIDDVRICVNGNCTSSTISLSTTSTPANCNQTDGSATATASGGNPPYTYNWSNGQSGATASGLSAGTYTVTVTDNSGATSSSSVTITEDCSTTPEICDNGIDDDGDGLTDCNDPDCANASNCSTGCGNFTVNIDVMADNCTYTFSASTVAGVNPLTFAWSNGATSSTITETVNGTFDYSVTVTDANGCTATASTNGSCTSNGGTNELCNNNIDDDGDGLIDCDDPDCNVPPVANFTWAIGQNGQVQFQNTSQNNPIVFFWQFGDGIESIAENPTNTYNQPGTYEVTLVAITQCDVSDTITQQLTIGDGSVRLYPGEVEGASGETVLLPIIIENLPNLAVLEGQLAFANAQILDVIGDQGAVIDPLFNPNNLLFSYFDQNGVGVSLNTVDTLFFVELLLTGQSGDMSVVDLVNTDVWTVENNNLLPVTHNLQTGKVTILANFDITGRIFTHTDVGIENVEVELQIDRNGTMEVRTTPTDINGNYSFTQVEAGSNCIITPSKNTNPRNGLNTIALFVGQRFILGLPTPQVTSPFQVFAGDASCDLIFSTFDLLTIQKLLVEIDDEFDRCESWAFTPQTNSNNLVLNTNYYIGQGQEIPDSVGLINQTNDVTVNFIGVKKGDILDQADPNSFINNLITGRATHTLPLQITSVEKGEFVEFTLRPTRAASLATYQLALHYDETQLQFVESATALTTPLANAKEDGTLLLSWFSPSGQGVKAEVGTAYITLRFRKKSQMYHSSSLIQLLPERLLPVGFTEELKKWDFALENTATLPPTTYHLYQNQPNPFQEATTIRFELPRAMSAELLITNSLGQVVKRYQGQFESGMNDIVIPKGALTPGWYAYTLQTADFRSTRRMVRVN